MFESLVEQLAHPDRVERLRAVAALRRELDGLERQLVAEAVLDRTSWREVGLALGISKQAAHAKHRKAVAARMAEGEQPRDGQVSDEARLAVRLAAQEAAALGRQALGTEHLLLGILRMERTAAAGALRAVGVTPEAVRSSLEPTVELSVPAAARRPAARARSSRPAQPVSPLARDLLERSLRESRAGAPRVGAEELLLSVLRDERSGAARTLERLGVSVASLRATVEQLRGRGSAAGA